jgi:serine/threonine protein kinase
MPGDRNGRRPALVPVHSRTDDRQARRGLSPRGRVVTDKEWQRAKEVLAVALERTPDERAAFLASQCGSDPAFLASLLRMLSDYESGSDIDNFLATQELKATARGSLLRDTEAGPQTTPPVVGPTTPRAVGEAEGHVWGDFVLLEQLGRGGFGVVYRAWERTLRREVALKLIESTQQPSRRESIQLEGQMLARIDHPNVVRIYGIHRRDEELAIAMEYVRGRTLANIVEVDGPAAPRDAAQTAATVAGALMAVHRGGLLHRDIKASNVMRAHDGRIVLMDFGAGRDLHREPDSRTRMIGTPVYMAPEILSGGHATPASDVYSLGVLTYFMLKGNYPAPPIPGVRSGPRPGDWATQALEGVPEGLAVLVGRMLAAEPAQRPAMDAALKRELTRAVPKPARVAKAPGRGTAEPVTPSPPTRPADVEPPRRELTWQVVAKAAVLGLLLVVAIGALSNAESNLVLGRHGYFSSDSLWLYFSTGLSSLVMPLALTCFSAVVVAGLMLIGRISSALAAGPASALRTTTEQASASLMRRGLLTRSTAEQVLSVLGLVAFVAILRWYHVLLSALTSRINDGPREVFGALNSRLEDNSTFRALLLVVLLALLASRYFTRRLPTDAASRVSSFGLVGVCILIGIVLAASYRVMETKAVRMVLYGADTCYVLGEHQREYLLHCPAHSPPRNRVVAVDDPKVRTTGDTGVPFDAYPLVPGYVPKPKP